jgi:hypothetical protein
MPNRATITNQVNAMPIDSGQSTSKRERPGSPVTGLIAFVPMAFRSASQAATTTPFNPMIVRAMRSIPCLFVSPI